MIAVYWCALAVFLVQIILFMSLNVRGNYSLIAHAVSDYGVGPTRRLFSLYGFVGIVAAALLALAILMDERLPALGGVYLLGMAAFRIGVLVWPTDLEGESLTRRGRLHYLFAILSFALAYMAIDALHPVASFLVADGARQVLNVLRWIVTASLIGVVVCMIPALRRVFGLVERIFLLSVMLWLAVFAAAMATL